MKNKINPWTALFIGIIGFGIGIFAGIYIERENPSNIDPAPAQPIVKESIEKHSSRKEIEVFNWSHAWKVLEMDENPYEVKVFKSELFDASDCPSCYLVWKTEDLEDRPAPKYQTIRYRDEDGKLRYFYPKFTDYENCKHELTAIIGVADFPKHYCLNCWKRTV